MLRKIADGTEATDLFGTGLHGFTSGNASLAIPATIVDHFNMNHLQEEVARAVEGSGQSITQYADLATAEATTQNYAQLDTAVQGMAEMLGTLSSITQGLVFSTSGASLDVTLPAGHLMWSGRRYVITDAKLSAAGYGSWTLPATRDSYFYIAPQDPAALVTDETTVHVETLDVAVGAGNPGTPAGTMLFARLTTDGSGVTAVQYFNHGLKMANRQNQGVVVRSDDGALNAAYVVPTGSAVDLGILTDDEGEAGGVGGLFFRQLCTQGVYLRTTYSSLNPGALVHMFTRHATTLGSGDTTDVTLYDEADYVDGAIIKVIVHATAHNEADASDSYAARGEFIVLRDGGAFSLDGSGAAVPQFQEGGGAITAGVTMAPIISGGVLFLRLTGHSAASNTMRWFLRFEVDITEPAIGAP